MQAAERRVDPGSGSSLSTSVDTVAMKSGSFTIRGGNLAR
jgi:hypothetical protein